MTLQTLVLLCKKGEESVPFSRKLSFFHGEMSTGKSTVAEMINFCFGADLVRTPAVTSEVITVQLALSAGDTDLLIERSIQAGNSVNVTWKHGDERGLETLPLKAAKEAVSGDDVHNFSDFLLRAMGVPLLKVRRRKDDAESELHRIGFRDFFKFVYLDQDELDSSFFLLETPIRQEKSKDVLRYVLGLHSDQLIEIEIALTELRQKQRATRENAKEIDEFLARYGFNSEEQIRGEIAKLNATATELDARLEALTPANTPSAYVSEEARQKLDGLTRAIDEKQRAVRDVEHNLTEQQALIAELLSLKLRVERSNTASKVLEGAQFHMCPACGSSLEKPHTASSCHLCHTDLADVIKPQKMSAAVVERDLIDRIEDLDRSIKRLKRNLERHTSELVNFMEGRGALQKHVDAARASGESQYMQRVRVLESDRGALAEKRRFLTRIVAMPSEVEARRKEADKMSEEISKLERLMASEQEKFSEGRTNVAELEENVLKIMRAIHFPGIEEGDAVRVNTKTWMPYILPGGNEERRWTFSDAGSGGKKVLFKICFALALHLTAAQRALNLPKLLIIDSTMKNITPDINRDVVTHFYKEVYRLLANELSEWQCILIDQTFFPPDPTHEIDIYERFMKKDDPKYPRLISYYKGH